MTDRKISKRFMGIVTDLCRATWGRKNSSAGNASLVNRATTPASNQSRTNSPTPATNAWTMKADERAANHSHDQFTHLLFTLTVYRL
jgi:hypothetical protein